MGVGRLGRLIRARIAGYENLRKLLERLETARAFAHLHDIGVVPFIQRKKTAQFGWDVGPALVLCSKHRITCLMCKYATEFKYENAGLFREFDSRVTVSIGVRQLISLSAEN